MTRTSATLSVVAPEVALSPTHVDAIDECRDTLRRGSKSFALAARLLPPTVRHRATVFYTFCRQADDAVDGHGDPQRALDLLRLRVMGLYEQRPLTPTDAVLAPVVFDSRLPRAVFDALLEGFAWDATGKSYATMSELRAYCVRVASTIGVAMCHFMDVHDPVALARACDLGVAMQLTNIARDIGEDWSHGRWYVPTELHARPDRAGVRTSLTVEQAAAAAQTLLEHAEPLYARAQEGIALLPRECQPAIAAASAIYRDIGRAIAVNNYDVVHRRAYVSNPRKLWLLLRSYWRYRDRFSTRLTQTSSRAEPALPEARFLAHATLDEGALSTPPTPGEVA